MLFFCCLVLPLKANSAITVYTGSDQSGVFTSEEDCPIEVVSEKLTFNIHLEFRGT